MLLGSSSGWRKEVALELGSAVSICPLDWCPGEPPDPRPLQGLLSALQSHLNSTLVTWAFLSTSPLEALGSLEGPRGDNRGAFLLLGTGDSDHTKTQELLWLHWHFCDPLYKNPLSPPPWSPLLHFSGLPQNQASVKASFWKILVKCVCWEGAELSQPQVLTSQPGFFYQIRK